MSAILGRDRFVLALALSLSVLGVVSWLTMPRQEDPSLTDRFGILVVPYPGADVLSVERLVADPIENALAEVDEIEHVSATLRSEVAIFTIELRDSVSSTDEAWSDVEDALARARVELPDEVLDYDFRHDGVETESVLLAITGSADPLVLHDAARALRRRLLSLAPVARVAVTGDPHEEVAIVLDESALRQHGLERATVARLLAARSGTRGGGSFALGSQSVDVRPETDFASIEQLRSTPIPVSADTSIPLGAIAEVGRRPREPASELVRHEGQPAVMLGVVPREAIDVTAFGEVVREAIRDAPLPEGLTVHELAYQPEKVSERLTGLAISLLQSLLVVAGVLVLFMGVRLGGVVATIVPLVALAAIAVYALGGGVLHQMSVAALVMSIGLLVDNAIVMAEDIQRRLDEGASRAEAASGAVRSLAWPLFTSTGTTVAAFVPMLLAEGPSGEFTRAIPIVVGLTLGLSYLFAIAVTPAIAKRVLVPRLRDARSRVSVSDRLATRIGRLAAERPMLALLLVAGVLMVGVITAGRVGKNFFPTSDREQLVVQLTLPEGTAIEETDRAARELEAWLRTRPETTMISTFVGRGAPRFYYNLMRSPDSPHLAQIVVTTRGASAVRSLQAAVRAEAGRRVPEAQILARRLEQGPPVEAPIEVRLYGDSLEALEREAAEVARALSAIPGAIEVRSSLGAGMPTLRLTVDDAGAMRHGLTRADVATALYGRTRGLPVATFRGGDEPVSVVLRSGQGHASPDELLGLGVDAPSGAPVPMAELAVLELEHAPASIRHRDRRRIVSVYAETAPSVTYVDVVARLTPTLETRSWAPGVRWELGGATESSGKANAALGAKAPLGLLLLVVFLLLEFNSVRRAIVILATAPLAVMGVWPGLLLADQPFGFIALLGMFALIGIVVNNAIVLVDYTDERRRQGASVIDALADAVRVRVRPILLTTATTVLGFVPLLDSRSTLWPPMAAAMISGLLIATLLTLFAVPALYRLLIRDAAASPQPTESIAPATGIAA